MWEELGISGGAVIIVLIALYFIAIAEFLYMYLTLGMTRRSIQTLFACETGLLSGLALMVGMGLGLVIFQLLAALFASILEIPFQISTYRIAYNHVICCGGEKQETEI